MVNLKNVFSPVKQSTESYKMDKRVETCQGLEDTMDLDSMLEYHMKRVKSNPEAMGDQLKICSILLVQKKYNECIDCCLRAFEIGRQHSATIKQLEEAVLCRYEAFKSLPRTTSDPKINVIVGTQVFNCSQRMLSEQSNYFKALLAFRHEGNSDSTRLENMRPETFQDILDMMKNPDSPKFNQKTFSSKSTLFEILDAAFFLLSPLVEVLAMRAIMDLEYMNEGNVLPHLIQARNHRCSALLTQTEEYFRTMYETLEHAGYYDDPVEILERSVDKFREIMATISNNGLAFFLILGWIEYSTSTRLTLLHELLSKYVIPELLTDRDEKCFDAKMYSFAVPIVFRIGEKPDRKEMEKVTWPKITLLCTDNTDSTDFDDARNGKQGIWVHKLLDGTFAWKRLFPFVDKDWAENPGWTVCSWEQTLYFVGGPTTDVWTLTFG